MRALVFCIFLSLVFAAAAHGSAGFCELEVLRWTKVGERELSMQIIDVRDNSKKTLHVRYGPHRVSHLIQQKHLRPAAQAEYDRAFALLSSQLSASKRIQVLLAAERGYSPIKGRKGHFRTELLKIMVPRHGDSRAYVCFFPPDLDTVSFRLGLTRRCSEPRASLRLTLWGLAIHLIPASPVTVGSRSLNLCLVRPHETTASIERILYR